MTSAQAEEGAYKVRHVLIPGPFIAYRVSPSHSEPFSVPSLSIPDFLLSPAFWSEFRSFSLFQQEVLSFSPSTLSKGSSSRASAWGPKPNFIIYHLSTILILHLTSSFTSLIPQFPSSTSLSLNQPPNIFSPTRIRPPRPYPAVDSITNLDLEVISCRLPSTSTLDCLE
jgi:hypothetical protein